MTPATYFRRGLTVVIRLLEYPKDSRRPLPPGRGAHPMTDYKFPDAKEQTDD
ncbi:MAG TPA: hypothetical protein VK395_01260 [Gemmataceae bacterium]|nr:hypothetical protein [Gemmataceae bacterium]